MSTVTLDPAWGEALAQEIQALAAATSKAKKLDQRKVVARALIVFAARLQSLLIHTFLGDNVSVKKGQPATLFRRKAVDATARLIYEELYWPTYHLVQGISSVGGAEKLVINALKSPSIDDEGEAYVLGLRIEALAKERKEVFVGKNSTVNRFFIAYWRLMGNLERRRAPYPEIAVFSKDRLLVEGFKIELWGGNADPSEARRELTRLTRVLSVFRKRMEIVAPRLVDKLHRVRLVVDLRPFAAVPGARGAFAERASMVMLFPKVIERETDGEYVQTIAHELGHVVYHILDLKTQSAWDNTVRGDMIKLSIAELLQKWPKDDKGGYLGAFELFDFFKDSDPVFALRIRALQNSGALGHDWPSYGWFAEALHDQHIETITVPGTPITGYANTNPEEAFCEAFGMLVAYGPRTILPKVYLWLSTVLGADVRRGTAGGQAKKERGSTRRKGRGTTLELGPDDPALRKKILAKAKLTTGFLNCRLFAQVMTGHAQIDSLPTLTNARVGDLLQWGENPARHFAFYIGGGDVVEVEEWGQSPRVVPMSTVTDEYETPTKIRSTREMFMR